MARIVDKDLLKSFQSKQCVICKAQAEPYHINGKHDLADNLLPICRIHNQKLKHLGLNYVVEEHPELEIELFNRGWYFDLCDNRWANYDLFEEIA